MSKGVTFHLLDVYLEELNGALQSPVPRRQGQDDDGAEAGFCPTKRLMEPFVHMAACCFDAATYERIMEKVFNPLLEDCLVRTAEIQLREAEEEEEDEEQEKGPKRKRARKPDDEEADEDSSVQFLAILKATRGDALDLRKDIFEALFEEASKAEANGARRKKIYAMFRREEERIEEEEEEEEEGAEEQDEE